MSNVNIFWLISKFWSVFRIKHLNILFSSGTSNDSWIGGSIVSQLNPDILVKIQHCFQDLQPQVKLKLLLSFFHIPRRNLEQWRRELENILVVARDDSEPWVRNIQCKIGRSKYYIILLFFFFTGMYVSWTCETISVFRTIVQWR